MRAAVLLFLCAAVVWATSRVPLATKEEVHMVVAYCPTDFSSEGAVVTVNVTSGAWKVRGKFKWPGSIVFGCVDDNNPLYAFDRKTKTVWFDFQSDQGAFAAVDLVKRAVTQVINPSDLFFQGFDNFDVLTKKQQLRGLTPTVTQNGFCNDGCFQYGVQNIAPGDTKFVGGSLVPFKAAMDDAHYLNETSNTFWFQGSYDLRQNTCGPRASSECLISLDATTGALKTAVHTEYTVYKFGWPSEASNGKLHAFVEGFDKECAHPYNNFAFAEVDLATAGAKLLGCIPKNTTVHTDQWISSFSADHSMFATGSGSAYTGIPQLLVFDTVSGRTVLNTNLTGLPEALGAKMKIIKVWAVEFFPAMPV